MVLLLLRLAKKNSVAVEVGKENVVVENENFVVEKVNVVVGIRKENVLLLLLLQKKE